MNHAPNTYKKAVIFSVKLVSVSGLLYFLAQKGVLSVPETMRALKRWDLLIPGTLMLFLNIFLAALRLQWLLEAQGMPIRTSRNFQLGMIGNFFNVALPGTVSGDLVKVFYIGREIAGKRGRAVGAIVFDRLVGLSALFLLSGATLLAGHRHFSHSMIEGMRPFILAVSAGVTAFYAYFFLLGGHNGRLLRFLRRIEKRFPMAGFLANACGELRHYHTHRWEVLKALGISLLIQCISGWACLQYARSLEGSEVAFLPVYLMSSLGLLITTIPVAPAGVGTGHAAFSYLFRLIGSLRGADVFTLFALGRISIGLLGGIVYLSYRASESRPNS
jgi:uncharacterized protein (TIRG00374 family)